MEEYATDDEGNPKVGMTAGVLLRLSLSYGAKLNDDPYTSETPWYKVKNPGYTQAEGRGDLFERRA